MSLFNRAQRFLGGGEVLRPVDYMVLMAVVMLVFVRFWT